MDRPDQSPRPLISRRSVMEPAPILASRSVYIASVLVVTAINTWITVAIGGWILLFSPDICTHFLFALVLVGISLKRADEIEKGHIVAWLLGLYIFFPPIWFLTIYLMSLPTPNRLGYDPKNVIKAFKFECYYEHEDDWILFRLRESKRLGASSADFSSADDEGLTPLHKAMESSLEVVKYLLKNGGNPNARCNDGTTPLHHINPYWVEDGAKKATLLLRAGAEPNARDLGGDTPLLRASWRTDSSYRDLDYRKEYPKKIKPGSDISEIIEVLVKAGADIEARPRVGNGGIGGTALLKAARAQIPDLQKIITLLKLGADASAKDEAGKCALDYAEQNEAFKGTDAYWKLKDASF